MRLRALQTAAADSDALLVVGSELGDSDLWEGHDHAAAPSSASTSTPPSWTRTAHADVALHGDAAATLTALLAALPAGG